MKKFIFNICLFCGCFILVFIVLEMYYKYSTPSEDRYALQYDELFTPQVNADIVIIGTSKAMRALNPKKLEDNNISAFNFSLNGSNPQFLYNWYNNYFKKYYPKPKLILFEVSWLMFNEEWMWRKIEQDSRYIPTNEYFIEFFNSKDKNTLFFNRYYIFNRTIGTGGIIDSTYHGYTPLAYKREIIEQFSDSITFNSYKQKQYFNLLLESFNEDSVDVIFVMLPEKIKKDFLGYKYIKENIDYLDKKLDDYQFLNYHQEFIADSLFSDWGHLNINGANIISEKILRDIKERTHYKVYMP